MLSLETTVQTSQQSPFFPLDIVPAPPIAVTVTPSWYVRHGKRTFDVVVSLLVVVFLLSWMFPLIGALIQVCSPGPVLFRQRRSGREGRQFWCLKFRTMHHKPGKGAVFVQCQKSDTRVTRIGKFLRKSNLDEMPQFLNVLLGDMSVVGPRPHAIQHDDTYWFSMANYHTRYQVRPGITGLAQVRGARGETDALVKMNHRVRYDRLYVKRQSLWLDIKLCFGTVMSMYKGNVNAW